MRVIIFLMFIFVSLNSNASQFSFVYGNNFTRSGQDKYPNPNRDILGVIISKNYFYIQSMNLKVNSNFTALGVQYQGKHKLGVDTHLGYGYLKNPDGKYGDGWLTNNGQFDVYIGLKYGNIGLGWQHISNCKSICNFNYSGANKGLDFITFKIGFQ